MLQEASGLVVVDYDQHQIGDPVLCSYTFVVRTATFSSVGILLAWNLVCNVHGAVQPAILPLGAALAI